MKLSPDFTIAVGDLYRVVCTCCSSDTATVPAEWVGRRVSDLMDIGHGYTRIFERKENDHVGS